MPHVRLLLAGPLALAAALAAAQDPAAPPGGPAGAADTAVIEITVRWEGDPPPSRPILIPPDFAARNPEDAGFCRRCIEEGSLRDESLVVDPATGGIANVAASLPAIRQAGATLPAATLANAKGRFEPRVQFLAVGSEVQVSNEDPFPHNARIVRASGDPVWNGILAAGQKTKTPRFLVAGLYRVHCDVHPWMGAALIAVKNPFCAVSGKDGRALIRDVPAGGGQEVVLWHETLGQARRKVDLAAGETARIALTQKDFAPR